MIFYATAFCQQFCWFIICEIINILFFFSREFSLPSRQNNWSLKDKTIRIVDKKPFRFVLDLVLACVLVQFIIEQNHRSNISFDTSFYKFFFCPAFCAVCLDIRLWYFFLWRIGEKYNRIIIKFIKLTKKDRLLFWSGVGKMSRKIP